jgi:hypothetical protein
MVLKETNADDSNLHSLLEDLHVELRNQLSMQQPQSKTLALALVEGGRRSPDYRGNGETVFRVESVAQIEDAV